MILYVLIPAYFLQEIHGRGLAVLVLYLVWGIIKLVIIWKEARMSGLTSELEEI